MTLGPVFVCLGLLLLPSSMYAQDQASLAVGAGIVRHEGGSSFSAFSLAPAAQRVTPSFYLGASGSISLIERGVWASQARGDLWTTLPRPRGSPRVALSATAAGSTRSDGVAAGSGSALVELGWNRERAGAAFGVGSAGGVIEGATPVGAPRLRARAWWQPGAQSTELVFSTEATRFLGAWYTDLVGGISLERPRFTASLWMSARVSGTYGSTGAVSAALQYFPTQSIALEVSGGNYLRDPFQGLPRAGFGGAAVRMFTGRHTASSARAGATSPVLRPLIAERRGDTAVVRFRMPGAHAVGIAGSWNAWTSEALRGLGNDIWEAALKLPSGTYYFNLVVDGKEWVVPRGVATVSDGMGGWIAVLTVP